MIVKELSKEESRKIFEEFNGKFKSENFDNLIDDYKQIRNDLLLLHNKYKTFKDYKYDLHYGLDIYNYFNSKDWFNETIASNYDFWRYICIKVIPDIIFKRHGLVPAYYYEKNVRICVYIT